MLRGSRICTEVDENPLLLTCLTRAQAESTWVPGFAKPPFASGRSAEPLDSLTLVVGADCTYGPGKELRVATGIQVHPGWTGLIAKNLWLLESFELP